MSALCIIIIILEDWYVMQSKSYAILTIKDMQFFDFTNFLTYSIVQYQT